MDFKNIKIKWEDEPKDNKLIELLKLAYTGELLVKIALIKAEGIVPFSDYKPATSAKYKQYFEDLESQGKPPLLFVYPKNNFFVMSDDYNAYYLYKEKNYSTIGCLVLGEPIGEYVIECSEPFKLPPPTAVDISG